MSETTYEHVRPGFRRIRALTVTWHGTGTGPVTQTLELPSDSFITVEEVARNDAGAIVTSGSSTRQIFLRDVASLELEGTDD